MPKDVGRNGFARQLRHVCRGYGDSPPHNVRRAESGETRTVRADEERARIMVIDPTFAYQCLQRFDDVVRDRHDPLFASLAAQEHLWSRVLQLKIARIDAERLGNARPGAGHEQKERSISATERRSLVRRVDQGINFVAREMMRDLCVRFFYWDREDALRDAERGRVVHSDMMKE